QRRAAGATPRRISRARSAATRRIAVRPIRMLGSTARGRGMEAKLCFIGHALIENRSGLIVETRLTRVSGHAERLAALDMIERLADRLGAISIRLDEDRRRAAQDQAARPAQGRLGL